MKTAFLVIATILTISSVLPYLRDIVRGSTRPNLVSWITWTLLTGIAAAAQVSSHEYVAAIFTTAATVETALVVLLGLRYGFVKYGRFDVACQLAAVIGLVLWLVLDSPVIAVVGVVIVDFIGALPTFRHSWMKPNEETWVTFALSAIGSGFALLALDTYNWINTPFTLYLVLANALTVAIILLRLRRWRA